MHNFKISIRTRYTLIIFQLEELALASMHSLSSQLHSRPKHHWRQVPSRCPNSAVRNFAGGSHPSLHASPCLLLCACITLCVTLAGAQSSCIVCLCCVLYEGRVWSCSTDQTPNFLAVRALSSPGVHCVHFFSGVAAVLRSEIRSELGRHIGYLAVYRSSLAAKPSEGVQ